MSNQGNEEAWSLSYWRTATGVCPVCEVHRALRAKDPVGEEKIRIKLRRFLAWPLEALFRAHYLEDLKNGLWELRVSAKTEFRLLGVVEYGPQGTRFVALHAFVKKGKKIRLQDMELALTRLKEYKNHV